MDINKSPHTSLPVFAAGAANEYNSFDSIRTDLRKTPSRSVKRAWNRLSRLQKSFLLIMIFIGLLFGAIVTSTSWVPTDTQSDRFVPHKEYRRPDPLVHINAHGRAEVNERIPPVIEQPSRHQASAETSGTGKRWGNQPWKLSQTSDTSVPTIPRALQPDFNEGNGDVESQHQMAENIRSVISLDPVVPLTGKKGSIGLPNNIIRNGLFHRKETSGTGMKFEGPTNPRQKAVVDAFMFAWTNYRKYAWGRDNLRPVSADGNDWFGLGLSLVDSLDTMYIMGLNREFYEARDWVESSLNFDGDRNVNLFETTIRVLGGLLSAYHLSGEKVFLDKAEMLGSVLSVAFKSPSGVPYSDVNLRRRTAAGPTWGSPDSTTSEVSSLQLEFRDLSRCTGFPDYEEFAMNVSRHIHTLPKFHGLVPMNINPNTGRFRSHSSVYTLGARADSYYEYLLKQWLQTGKTVDFLKDDYLEAIEGMKLKMLRHTFPSNLTYFGELEHEGKTFKPKMDHLVCFLPGTLALGYINGLPEWHLTIAKELLQTCYETYIRMPTKLAAEITYYRTSPDATDDLYVLQNDAHNLLRPETIESLWYLYQITGNKVYQDWGWEIFQSFVKYTRVEYGFSSISSVLHPNSVRPKDMMESFFLSETLKYFYLLFADRVIFDLNSWVFNTEAHPLPLRTN